MGRHQWHRWCAGGRAGSPPAAGRRGRGAEGRLGVVGRDQYPRIALKVLRANPSSQKSKHPQRQVRLLRRRGDRRPLCLQIDLQTTLPPRAHTSRSSNSSSSSMNSNSSDMMSPCSVRPRARLRRVTKALLSKRDETREDEQMRGAVVRCWAAPWQGGLSAQSVSYLGFLSILLVSSQ